MELLSLPRAELLSDSTLLRLDSRTDIGVSVYVVCNELRHHHLKPR